VPARRRTIGKGIGLVYEDPDVIVVDKPAGIVTADPAHAAGAPKGMRRSAREGETVFDAVKKHVREGIGKKRRRRDDGAEALGRVWIIHRLDKEASGLLVFAKTERAFATLKEAFKAKTAHRVYVAVCEGLLGGGQIGHSGTRRSLIREDRGPRQAGDDAAPADERKPAVTHYQVVHAGSGRTLVKVRLETGRKNQIRIHMQELDHPLIGDRRFGATTDPIRRLALHAAELGFEHPADGRAMRFESPAPEPFMAAVGLKEGAGPGAGGATLGPREGASPVLKDQDTSWNAVAEWYDKLLEPESQARAGKPATAEAGNDHFERTILPGVLELLQPRAGERMLDAACGQGLLTRRLASLGVKVVGVDAAPKLIQAAKERAPEGSNLAYFVADARELPALVKAERLGEPGAGVFDAVTCVMALANIDPLEDALASMSAVLKPGGRLVFAITHPAFRAPGETDWAWDEKRRRQFRRVDVYLTPYAKGIAMHPGKAAAGRAGGEITTRTFHRPIGAYVRACARAGLVVDDLREWISERAASSGPRAPEENRARTEIPLFMGVRARKAGA
jgi:RluA family pseudouridine synthase